MIKSIWSCDVNPANTIKKGMTVLFSHVWGHVDGGVSPATDIELLLKKDCTIAVALILVEEAALEYVKSHGADDIRQYCIEDVRFTDNRVEFIWGT